MLKIVFEGVENDNFLNTSLLGGVDTKVRPAQRVLREVDIAPIRGAKAGLPLRFNII